MDKIEKVKRGGKILLKAPKHIFELQRKSNELQHELRVLQKDKARIEEELIGTKKHFQLLVEEASSKLMQTGDRLSDLQHQLTALSRQPSQTSSHQTPRTGSNALLADNHLLDHFYVQFENNFRGDEKEIKKRQETYLPYLEPIKELTTKYPVIDIGCGRGEFIELLDEHGFKGIGLDLNKTMVELVKQKGLEAVEANVTDYLKNQKANSISVITGFHIVEHIPFDTLVELFSECYRSLVPGGFVIFETPNPENVTVGSCNFYMDPSHLHPIPPALLEFTMQTRGFAKVEILRLHPKKTPSNLPKNLPEDLLNSFYGPQDYAVIAYK